MIGRSDIEGQYGDLSPAARDDRCRRSPSLSFVGRALPERLTLFKHDVPHVEGRGELRSVPGEQRSARRSLFHAERRAGRRKKSRRLLPCEKQAAALFRIGEEISHRLRRKSFKKLRHDDHGIVVPVPEEGVFLRDLQGVARVAEEIGQTGDLFTAVAGIERIGFPVPVPGGKQKDGLPFRLAAEAVGFPGPHEVRQCFHPPDLRHTGASIPVLRDVILEAAAERDHRRSLLQDLDRVFGNVPRLISQHVPEIPGHQIPGVFLACDGAACVACRSEGIRRAQVARNEIHRRADFFRHMVGIRPVGRDLEIRVLLMQRVHIFSYVPPEKLPTELPVFLEIRVASFSGQAPSEVDPRFLFKRPDGLRVEIHPASPAVAVHPDAVDAVFPREFRKLRDQEFVGVAAHGAGGFRVPGPVGAETSLFRMLRKILLVDDAGIVHIERDALFPGDFSPQRERIQGERGHGVSQSGGVGCPARMPLAVDLEKIGFQEPADLPDLLFLQRRADRRSRRAFRRGVEIEMQSEKAFPAAFHKLASFFPGPSAPFSPEPGAVVISLTVRSARSAEKRAPRLFLRRSGSRRSFRSSLRSSPDRLPHRRCGSENPASPGTCRERSRSGARGWLPSGRDPWRDAARRASP